MSEISKQALKVDNNTSFPNNTTGYISPSILRAFNTNMIDSLVDEITFTAFSGSVTSSIQLLNAYTASIQPSFTSLNAFSASQLLINTGYNATTQSLSASIATVVSEVDQLQTWSSSVNEIRFNNGIPEYATRWNFGGFISASFVPNVGGLIADITVLEDGTKLNTSSFNAYTASTNAQINSLSSSQAIWNASATASLQQLLNLSSSLSGGYATQGELDAVDNKLNVFSSSQNLLNGTFATTGSNTFYGEQYINGGTRILGGGLNIAANTENSGSQYGIMNIFTDPITYSEGGIFSGYQIVNVYDPNNSTAILEMAANSYTQQYPQEAVAYIGGGGADGNGSTSAIIMRTGSVNMEVFKPTIFDKGIIVSSSFHASGSITTTGSVLGNVVPLTITSNTASMDLSKGNFFTLTLVSGSATRLSATNIQPGQTINLLVSQPSSSVGTISYTNAFKFPAGVTGSITAVSGATDIISFITFGTTSLYSGITKNLY